METNEHNYFESVATREGSMSTGLVLTKPITVGLSWADDANGTGWIVFCDAWEAWGVGDTLEEALTDWEEDVTEFYDELSELTQEATFSLSDHLQGILDSMQESIEDRRNDGMGSEWEEQLGDGESAPE